MDVDTSNIVPILFIIVGFLLVAIKYSCPNWLVYCHNLIHSSVGNAIVPMHSFQQTEGMASRQDRFKKFKVNIDGKPYKVGDLLPAPLSDYFLNKDGLFIFTKRWVPKGANIKSEEDASLEKNSIKGVVVMVHGVCEHIGRYAHVAKSFLEKGFVVYGLDHQGHGRSEGDRTYIRQFEDLADDVILVSNRAKRDFPDVPLFLLGHSLGGLVAIQVVEKAQKLFKSAVFSAPALEPKSSLAERLAAGVLVNVVPKLQTHIINPKEICHSPIVVDMFANDPIVVHNGSSVRLGYETLMTGKYFTKPQGGAKNITIPYLMIRGSDDQVCLRNGIAKFHELTSSRKKEFVEYKGCLHEVMNEEGNEALKKVISYFSSNLSEQV